MKIYTCTKPCVLGGQRFFIGDTISGDLIAPEREKQLIKYGLLAASEAVQPAADENKGEATGERQTAPDASASANESDNPKASAKAPEPDATAKTKTTGKKVQK